MMFGANHPLAERPRELSCRAFHARGAELCAVPATSLFGDESGPYNHATGLRRSEILLRRQWSNGPYHSLPDLIVSENRLVSDGYVGTGFP